MSTTNTSTNADSAAAKARDRRKNLANDPVKHAAHKAKERERVRKWRKDLVNDPAKHAAHKAKERGRQRKRRKDLDNDPGKIAAKERKQQPRGSVNNDRAKRAARSAKDPAATTSRGVRYGVIRRQSYVPLRQPESV